VSALFGALLRLVGLPGLILIGGYLFYEGLPGFARIPYLTSVPVLGDLTTGRVAVERAKGFAEGKAIGETAERARWEEARKRAEILKSQRLAEAQAKISAADQTLQDFKAKDRRRAEAIQRALSERQDDEQNSGRTGCDLSQCFLPDRVWQELQ
jgi:hypothetical protein